MAIIVFVSSLEYFCAAVWQGCRGYGEPHGYRYGVGSPAVLYGQQYAEIWRSHNVIWQDTENGASASLDHHCGTLCR